MLECVINISEGRDEFLLARLDAAAGPSLRDRHSDPHHHRSVFTLINDRDVLRDDVRSLCARALDLVDLRSHDGVHPRLGVVDVVPFVPLGDASAAGALEERDRCARWLGEHGVPAFLYGELSSGEFRDLPTVRREAFSVISPEFGPAVASPRSGASAVGAREILVAWNIWLTGVSLEETRRMARELRRPGLRTLGLAVGSFTQVSCNLVDWRRASPLEVYDAVLARVGRDRLVRAELVGLAPTDLLRSLPESRWGELGFDESTTIESRLT
ncbi:MAG: hypothetical protein KGR42_00740 [Acidobacteria bacterium]|nr:hypothetical protein [Acidobacteriota bacterium]